MAEKGTMENPFDNLQDAFDACDRSGKGPGKIIWVHNPDAVLEFYEIDEEDYEFSEEEEV